jgi:biotin carboxyl carrier protein
VTQGDVLGWIDVLGVRQEVVAPEDGLVGKLLVGPGDPVEYGEQLVQLVAGAAKPERAGQDGAEA